MALYGIYGEHTLDNCPLYNRDSRLVILEFDNRIRESKDIKFIGMYHSALEHTFLWAVECEDPHKIQSFLIESNIAKYNSTKIVPLSRFENLVNTCKRLEEL